MFGVMHNGNKELHSVPSIDDSFGNSTFEEDMPKTPKHMPLPKQYPPVGFKNWGNTCYANASLQCLMSTALSRALLEPKFFDSFSNSVIANYNNVEDDDPSEEKAEEIPKSELCRWVTKELTKLCKEYSSSNNPDSSSSTSSYNNFLIKFGITSKDIVIDPGNITRNVTKLSNCFTQGRQEDAHEFLRALISTLVMDGFNKKLSSLFDGLLESSVTCQTCNSCSTRRDRYMDLSLEISDPCIGTLHDALSHFTKTESLGKENMVDCNKCQKRRQVSKGLRLATAPTILVCHLKRFMHDKYGRISRVSKSIEFPLFLDISNCMSKVNRSIPPLYELVGVLVHQGQSCTSGHYISYVKSGEEWYRISDNHVVQVEVSYVMQQKAYILMYEVQGMRNHKIPYSLSSTGISRTFSNASDNYSVPPWRKDAQIEKMMVDPCEIFSFLCTNSCFGLDNTESTKIDYHRKEKDVQRVDRQIDYHGREKERVDRQSNVRSNSLSHCEEHHKEILRRHHSKSDKEKVKNVNHRRARSLSRTRSNKNQNTEALSRSTHGYSHKGRKITQPVRRNGNLPPRPARSTSRTSY